MPHDIYEGHMAYAGAPPWHGLGVALPASSDYETISRAAGFYTVQAQPLYLAGAAEPVPDRKALVTHEGRYLATVSTAYKVVQFNEVAEALVTAGGGVGAVFTTAGLLGRRGERGWLLAELPEPLVVRGDPSPIRRYLLGYAGHDGTTAITLKATPVRVVCQNTLCAALRADARAEWHIPHAAGAPARLAEAARAFRALVEGYARFGELANVLAQARLTAPAVQGVLARVLPLPDDEAAREHAQRTRRQVLQLYEAGTGIEGAMRGSAWALLNACVEYNDWQRLSTRAITGRRMAELRFENALLGGRGAAFKREALHAVAEAAGVRLAA